MDCKDCNANVCGALNEKELQVTVAELFEAEKGDDISQRTVCQRLSKTKEKIEDCVYDCEHAETCNFCDLVVQAIKRAISIHCSGDSARDVDSRYPGIFTSEIMQQSCLGSTPFSKDFKLPPLYEDIIDHGLGNAKIIEDITKLLDSDTSAMEDGCIVQDKNIFQIRLDSILQRRGRVDAGRFIKHCQRTDLPRPTLRDILKEETIRNLCIKLGIDYSPPK